MKSSANLVALETFYWVAHLQSFSLTAEQLNVTQPTVSYRIKELEAQIGTQLIVRNGRKLGLTNEGEMLRRYAEQIIHLIQAIETNVRGTDSRVQRLRLGVIDSFAAVCLPLLINRLEEKFPHSNIAFTVHHSHNLSKRLSDGEIDLAILSTPPIYENLELDLLGYQHVDWVANPTLVSRDTDIIRLLETHHIFSTPAPSNIYELTEEFLRARSRGGVSVSTCNSISVIYSLIRSGVGTGLMPTRMIREDVEMGNLVLLNSVEPFPLQKVFIATNKGLRNPGLAPTARVLRQVSKEVDYCIS